MDPGAPTSPTNHGLWRIKVHGSANADCSGDKVEAASAEFATATANVYKSTMAPFNDMQAGQDNVFPNVCVSVMKFKG